jgi:chromosome segregation protein
MRIADLKAKADHIRARAVEEFEYTVELKSYPDDEFVDFASLRDEIQALRDKGRALGNINFAAFEEYSTEKERLDFLTGQRKDLLEAEKTLLATIEEINTTAQQKFLETFDLIRTNFIETFKSLFDPGDECDLLLEEEVDPLEGGIEIIAKPRGKRPTSIDLLSGGGENTYSYRATLRHLPRQAESVLHSGRGRCTPGRCEYRPLHPHPKQVLQQYPVYRGDP